MSDSRAKSEACAQIWKNKIKAAQKEKTDWTADADEVESYFRSKHARLYRDLAAAGVLEDVAGVSVNKAAQLRGTMGPHLYKENPTRKVVSRTDDAVMAAMGRVLEAYLNYTPDECDLERQARKAIDDSLLRGRGFLRVGFDEVREVVTSWYVSSRDVLIDPDFDSLDDAKWVAIRRRETLWEIKRKVDKREKWRVRDLRANMVNDPDQHDEDGKRVEEGDDRDRPTPTNKIVEYWEIYSKTGVGWRLDDKGAEDYRTHDDTDDFVKISVAMNHDVPLEQGPWEVPLYLDDAWPIEPLDLVEDLDQLWPTSIFAQALSHQKAMDVTSTISLDAARRHSRDVYLVDKDQLDADAIDAVTGGKGGEVIPVSVPKGGRLDGLMARFDTGDLSPEVGRERDWHERQMEMTTGMTSALHGATDTGAQERSATAVTIKKEASNVRLSDFQNKVDKWLGKVARLEALCVRLLDANVLDAEDVGDVFRRFKSVKRTKLLERYKPMLEVGFMDPAAIDRMLTRDMELGWLPALDAGAGELPVRDTRTEEEKRKGQGGLSLEQVSPELATYYPDQQSALKAAIDLIGAMQMSSDPSVRQAFMALLRVDPQTGQPAINPQTQLPLGVSVRQVEVPDVWRDTAGLTPKELAREHSYSITSGVSEVMTPERMAEVTDTLMQQVLPPAIQTGSFDLANAIWFLFQKQLGIPEEERMPGFQPPPPPPPPPGEAGPPPGPVA